MEAFLDRVQEDIEKTFLPTLRLLRSSCTLETIKGNEDLLESCQSSLSDISSHSLRGWNSSSARANRTLFKDRGGLEIVLQIYASVLHLHWDSRGELLKNIERYCLKVLWNLSETADDRLYIVQRGGFEMVLKSLSHSNKEFAEKYTVGDGLCFLAIGCLSN